MPKLILIFLGLSLFIPNQTLGGPVVFRSQDNVEVFGNELSATAPTKGVILLFHQAGSNSAEYAPIAPRLAALGWSTLAIDQRSGGSAYGRRNLTAERFGKSAGYEAALPDLEAALDFAQMTWPNQKLLAWGSSYSAALTFVLAARHPRKIDGILAFSPGEYLAGVSVSDAAAKLTIPIFATAASDAGEQRAVEQILAASPSLAKIQFVPRRGSHGSSTLREDANPGGAQANWEAVEKFLARF